MKNDSHEFCEKELDALRRIVKELRQAIKEALSHPQSWKVRHPLRIALEQATKIETNYWKDDRRRLRVIATRRKADRLNARNSAGEKEKLAANHGLR